MNEKSSHFSLDWKYGIRLNQLYLIRNLFNSQLVFKNSYSLGNKIEHKNFNNLIEV